MRILFQSLLLIILLSCQLPMFAMDDDYEEESGHEDQKSYLLYDHIYLRSQKKENWRQKPQAYINTIFPTLSSEDDNPTVTNFNETINEFLTEERSEFKKLVDENKENQKQLPTKLQKNTLYIDYASAYVRSSNNKSRILSVKFTIQRYIGGMAHPEVIHSTFNYDLNNAALLELSSLFKDNDYLVVLSGIVTDSLTKKLKNNFDKTGVEPTNANFSRWNIRAEGLLFTFDEGQVAPRVYGAQTVLVPYKLIPGLLSEESIISHCLNRKSRCLASSLLTGGFLDEASTVSYVKSTKTRSVA